MTKEEFRAQLKPLVQDLTPEQKENVKRIFLDIDDYMSWTHCHHCGRSNHRYFNTFLEDYEELCQECSDDKCIHCGGSVVVYCGWSNGETMTLPSREDVLWRVKNVKVAFTA